MRFSADKVTYVADNHPEDESTTKLMDMINKVHDDFENKGVDAMNFWESLIPNPMERITAVMQAHLKSVNNFMMTTCDESEITTRTGAMGELYKSALDKMYMNILVQTMIIVEIQLQTLKPEEIEVIQQIVKGGMTARTQKMKEGKIQ